MNNSKTPDSVVYTAEGAIVKDIEPEQLKRYISRRRERNILLPSPKIYVDDGSNGTNLVNTYSYKNYCERGEKPSIQNNYANNYKTTLTSNPVYDAADGLRLHPTADSGGYSNFTIAQYIK
jgi:hypothetical protein